MSGAPDPTNPDLLLGIFTYLNSAGITRDPQDGTTQLPPLWVEPQFGTPAPGQTEGIEPVEVGPVLVVSIQFASGIPQQPYEGFIRQDAVEFVVRANSTPTQNGVQAARAFENQVRTALNDKRGWMMANVPVNESLLFRDLQPVDKGPLGWTYTMEYLFSLWGPFTPVGP